MGWFWSSNESKPPSPPPQAQPPPAPKEQTPASTVDPEVAKFLALFEEDNKQTSEQQQPTPTSTPSSTTTSSRHSSSSPSAWISWPSSQPPNTTTPPSNHASTSTGSNPPAPSPLAASLLPTTMNCRQAFDQAWECQSPVGQWQAVYRYGTARDCSELWSDFWFCMRAKGHAGGPESKAETIRAHYAAKEYAKYGPGQPSSEDVWASREEKVEPGSVMNVPLDDLLRR